MFKTKKFFGLDVSDNSIEVMLLSKSFKRIKVISYGRKILRGEIVKDGVIKNKEKLAQAISKVLKEAQPQPIRVKDCIVSLPESKVFTHVFYFPVNLSLDQIKNALPYEAEKIIPFRSDEVYFDFKVINKDKKFQEVFYAATYPSIVKNYLEVLEKIELNPIAFDLESISLQRALINKKDENTGILIVDLGARSSNLNIFYRRGLRASTLINIGGNRFTKAIAKEMNISEDEAEKIKAKVGFEAQKDQGKLLFILQKEFKRIIKEAKEILEYYSKKQKTKVTKIILAGGSSLLPKVSDYLKENLNIETVLADPFVKLSVAKDFASKGKSVLFANVIGLALRGIGKKPKTSDIDLLAIKTKKFEIVPQKKEKRAWRRIYIGAGLFVVLIILFGVILFIKSNGVDVYNFVLPEKKASLELEVNLEELEQLREDLLEIDEPIVEPIVEEEIVDQPSEESIITKQVLILETGIGYLNVRSGPGTGFEQIEQIIPGEEYTFIEESNGWYKIQVRDDFGGWIINKYAEIMENDLE